MIYQGKSSPPLNFMQTTFCFIELYIQADCDVLQKDLDTRILNQWAKDWQRLFNLSKCELIRISNKRCPLRHCYHMQEELIKSVHHRKYLGTNNHH